MRRLAFYAIPLICFVACEKSHQPASPNTPVSAATTSQSEPAESSTKSNPASHEKLIDPDSTGGVRGTQLVTFVVTADAKPIQGATVLVASADSPKNDENTTDDWGEYHTSLAPGSYWVKVSWRHRTQSKTIRVDAKTQEIDLKLDTPSN